MNEHRQQSNSKYARLIYLSIAIIILICIIIAGIVCYHATNAKKSLQYNVTDNLSVGYVDNKTCLQCHQKEANEWVKSHHANAMRIATNDTVLGNFDQTTYRQKNNLTTTFFQRDNQFFVNTQGPDGKSTDFKISYTFGVDPIQQYLIALPNGRLQNFTIAWDVKNKRWFDLYPDENAPAGDVLHWTGHYQNANMMCIGCHTTDYKKQFDAKTDSYHSTWSDLGVNCQACHGPGENHVKWAKNPVKNDAHKGLANTFNTKDNIIDTCAICHSRRSELSSTYGTGDAYMNHFLPALLTEDLFYPDGQQQAEVYVYNSFKQSKMYQFGVICTDCHNPHTGKLKLEGNAVCTQCHSPTGDKRFPTAAKLYDDPSHTFHPKGSPGAACVNCHMPAKKYMQIHSRPDHSIRIPRPDLSMQLGTPNACTTCHTDKSAKWANDWINKWHGQHTRTKHYGELFAAARKGDATVENELIELANDNNAASIIRATALNQLNHYGVDSINTSIKLLQDNDPLIRHAALTNLEKVPLNERVQFISSLLTDSILAVRIEAARLLAGATLSSKEQQQLLQQTTDEFITTNKLSLDMPGANLNLAVLNESQGNTQAAEQFYLNALHIDPAFTPARVNLATLYNQTHQNEKTIATLQQGINFTPNQGEFYYALGLIHAEENNLTAASNDLKQAAALMPQRTRIRYNYALLLQQVGEKEKSLQELLTLVKLEPNNADYLYALTTLYTQMNNWQDAWKWAQKLSALNPNNEQLQAFVADIRLKAAQ